MARCRRRLTTLLHEDTQNGMRSVIRFLVGHSSDVMTVALPRASVWGSALLMESLPPRCRTRVAGHIVSWTANSPLVGKLEIFFATLRSKRRSALVSGGGTADQLTGSLLTNLMILETMLSSDFLSDLSLSSYGCIA